MVRIYPVLVIIGTQLEKDYEEEAAKIMNEAVKTVGYRLMTGNLTTPMLIKMLYKFGYGDTAWKLFTRCEYPSWGFMMANGATTIWERWNSVLPDGKISGTGMNSLNHYTYGSIMQWMYENMCGLNLTEIGFKKFTVNPEYTERFDFAEMEYNSAYGKIKVKWTKKDSGYSLFVKVPFDTEACVTIPGTKETVCLKAGEYNF